MKNTITGPRVVAEDVTIYFVGGALALTGTVIQDPRTGLLELENNEGPSERLSVNLVAYGLVPTSPDEVFIKDWSEGRGVAESLVKAGVAEEISEVFVGPFRSRAVLVRLLAQKG